MPFLGARLKVAVLIAFVLLATSTLSTVVSASATPIASPSATPSVAATDPAYPGLEPQIWPSSLSLPNSAPKVTGLSSLVRLLARNAGRSTIPKTLFPTIAHARDKAIINNLACMEKGEFTERGANCTFGDTSATRSIWLIGDSHAGQWFFPMDQIAKEFHYQLKVHAKASCETQTPSGPQRPYPNCAAINLYWQQAISSEHPDIVVVGMYQGVAAKVLPNVIEYLAALAKDTKHLVILGDTPKQKGNVVRCMTASKSSYANCVVPTSKAFIDGLTKALRGLASNSSNITYIDAKPWLCTATVCPPILGNVLMYRDQNHITGYASVLLEPVLRQALLPVL